MTIRLERKLQPFRQVVAWVKREASQMNTPTVEVHQDPDGSASVTLRIPGCETTLELTMSVELEHEDGCWRVSIPWPDGVEDAVLPDGHEVLNGLIYVARPED